MYIIKRVSFKNIKTGFGNNSEVVKRIPSWLNTDLFGKSSSYDQIFSSQMQWTF